MRKKIAICITAYEPGGQAVVVEETSRRFARFYDVDLYCVYSKKSKPAWIKNIYYVKPWLHKYIPIVNKKFIEKIRKEKYDVIHCHDSLPFMRAFNSSNIDYYVTCHGNCDWRFRSGLVSKIDGVASLIFYGKGYRGAKTVFAISKYIKKWLKDTYEIDAKLIYNGVSREKFYTIDNPRRLMIFNGSPVLLYFGQISGRKGIVDLIEGIERLRIKQPEILLLIGGFGDSIYLSKIKDIIEERKLWKNIRFLGYVKDADQVVYYNSCDVVVTASYWEGFGLPIIEAYSCNKPIFARNSTAMAELVVDERFTFINVNDMVDKIERYLSHPEKFEINFKKIINLNIFDWDYSARQYIESFN